MSRPSDLPPRCPFQKKNTTCTFDDSFSPRHQKSVSQSSLLEEQPAWLDDLLSDTKTTTKGSITNTSTKGSLLRRSVSDPVTLMDGLVSFPSFAPSDFDESLGSSEGGCGLESSCMYGPNSPRRRGRLTFPENAMVSKVTEYLSQRPTQYLDRGLAVPEIVGCDLVQGADASAGEANVVTKAVKRHSGQRSRVRKLQYIAELERTVDDLQILESELAIKVASLLQQRVSLSMENNKLKQQVARLKQEKVFVDGQYRSLKRELERLKSHLAYSTERSVSTEQVSVEVVCKMLDIGKLDLNR